MFNAIARVLNDDANKLIYALNGPLIANFSNFTDKLGVLAAYTATHCWILDCIGHDGNYVFNWAILHDQ